MIGTFSGAFSGAFAGTPATPSSSTSSTSVKSPVVLPPQVDAIVVIPTAINVCLVAAENITANLRARQASDLELPSLYKRAFLVAYETDEVALVRRQALT